MYHVRTNIQTFSLRFTVFQGYRSYSKKIFLVGIFSIDIWQKVGNNFDLQPHLI